MNTVERATALESLQSLVNQSLVYGIKSPDTELYDFGFAKASEYENGRDKQQREFDLVVHCVCCVRVIRRSVKSVVERYDGDSDYSVFASSIGRLLGLPVKRVALSDKNDLWLDFGEYWMVLVTFEDDEESWRFFSSGGGTPHMVVTNTKIELID